MSQSNRKTRYQRVSEGIRKDLKTGNYEAYKKVNGVRYCKTFRTIIEARSWRGSYVPSEIRSKNGKLTFGEVLDLYIKEHLSHLAKSTQGVRLDRLKFFDEFSSKEIESITPNFIHRFFLNKKRIARTTTPRRMNFDQEIKDLCGVFNWYKDHFNYRFFNPVLTKRLKSSCVIRKEDKLREKLSADEFIKFLNALHPFYRDVAIVQTRMAGRISEVAGLQFKNIDFENKKLMVKDIVVYGRKKEFVELKSNPKSGEIRQCYLTPNLEEVLRRRFDLKAPDSDYVFHMNGEPLKYRSVQHAYDSALKKVGLYGRFSGTHILRHFTAGITRLVCGNIDAVQAVTGHKSVKLAEHYSGLDSSLQADSITKVENFLEGLNKSEGCAKDVQESDE